MTMEVLDQMADDAQLAEMRRSMFATLKNEGFQAVQKASSIIHTATTPATQ